MSQGTGQRVAKKAESYEDELSLDDLDRVVGGRNTAANSEQPLGEGGPYVPPTVTAPDHLPTQISQIEQQVTNHTITGDQAVSQIAGIIGSQPDHSMQNIAGAEIASLIGRGIIDTNSAIADLHTAVTQTHSLTGDQAAGVLAGMVVAQYYTNGEDASISTAAKAEITNLISAGALTPDHAVTAVAAQTGHAGGMILMSEITSLVYQYSLTPAQVGADIVSTVDSNDLTGTQAITLLAGLATSFPAANHPFLDVAGQEIASLVSQHNIDPTDAMNALVSAVNTGLADSDVPGLMLAVVDADPALADAAGARLASLMQVDPYIVSHNGFQSAVTSIGATADHTMALLLSAAHNGATSWASEMAVELYTNHAFSMTQVMTAIQDNASTPAHADDAVTMLHGLVNSGYASAFAAPAEAALVAMIQNHQITATQAAADLSHMVTSSDTRGFELLVAVATAGTSDATSAVTAAVESLAQSMGASTVLNALAGLVGASSLSAANPTIDAAALQQVSALVSSGALTADAAIEALANVATTTFRWTGKEALCNEIATIAASAHPPLSATQVMADVMAVAATGDVSNTVLVLGFLAGHGADFRAAAGAALAAIIDPNNPSLSHPLWIAADVTYWVGSTSTLSAASAIALLTAAVGNGSTAMPPDAAGNAIAVLITNANIAPADVTAAIHAAVVGGFLGGDAALVLLANLADNASTAQIAVNTEMLALVTGSSPFVQPGHAADVLTALRDAAQAAHDTGFVTILNAELAVIASSDPATAVFNALSTTTSATDLETAAAQLASAMASGASSAATVMADIDAARAHGTLTVPQAAELLVDIAAHGNLAAQTAAGAEFAKITNTAGTSIFGGSAQTMTSQAILACIGIGLGGSPDGTYHVSTTMTSEAALAFVMGALGSATTTDATRLSLQDAMATLLSGNWSGVPVFFPAPNYGPPGMASSFATAIGDIASAHAMSGPELIRAVFVLGDGNYFSASRELQTLIGSQSVSMADVHTAITSGWWQIDNAVQVLAGVSSTPAVMTELMGLISGGSITASQFIADIHEALTPLPYVGAPPWPLTAADYVRVMEALAPSANSAVQAALVTELAAVINDGSLSMTNAQAILAAAGSNQSALVDQILVALDGNDFGQLVSANLVTLDHALSALVAHNEVYDAVTHAVTAGTCDLTLLTNGLIHAVSDGTLSASDANTMALQMAETSTAALGSIAGALLAAVVSSGGMSADAVMSELSSNANKYAHVSQGSVGINIPQMTNVLNGFIAHCDPSSSAAAAQEAVTLSQVAFGFFPSPGSAFPFVIAAAGNADAAGLSSLAGMLEGMISRGDTNIDAVATALDGLAAGANALALYTGIAKYATMGGATQIMSDALGKIMDLLPNHVSASAAVLALNNLVGSASTFSSGASYTALVQAAGAEINAISAAYPDANALSGIDDAIRAGTMTAVQAAQMLVGMINGSAASAAVATEINTLIQEHLLTAGQIADAVVSSGTAQSHSADTIVTALANLVTISPAVANAAGGHIEAMIQSGQISATQAVNDLYALMNNPLTVAQSIGLFTSVCIVTGTTSIMDAVNDPIADRLVVLLNASVITAQQMTDGIASAVRSGAASADQAIALYATIARGHSDQNDLAGQGITALITTNALSANAAFGDIRLVFADATDLGIPFMLAVATNASATAAFQAAFANCLAGLVVPDAAPVTPGFMHVSDAFAFVHNAYQQGLTTPHAPGTITAQQELSILANMLAAGSNGGPASSLLTPVHTELVALITSHALADTTVVAALEAVGANNATIQAVVNTEIGHLESDIGPQMLIDVAAQTGADIADVGSQLATMIANRTADINHVIPDIVSAANTGSLSGSQALTMIASLLGHATGSGAYAIMQLDGTAISDWKTMTAWGLEQLAQHGLAADTIAAAIEGVAGTGPALMSPSYAVGLLANMAAYSDLQGAAASHIASMLANGSLGLTGADVTSTVLNNISTYSGHLQAADAVRLLVLVAASNGSPAIYGAIADELGDPQLSVHIAADTVAGTIESMVQSGALTAQQALRFLAPYGDVAPGAAGHAIGDLIVSNQVTMANFLALIHGGVSQNAQQIDGTRFWQDVFGTGDISFTSAMLVLTAMTSRTSAAVTELTSILSADQTGVWFIVETALVSAGQNPTTSSMTPQEIVRGLTVLVADPAAAAAYGGSFAAHAASDISNLIGPSMGLADALAQIISVSANGPQALSQGAAAIAGALIGSGPANGTDALIGAVGHGITADQAVMVLTELSTSQSINLQSHIRTDIAYLIANGQLSGTQALNDVHSACIANGISTSQELSLLAGIYATSNGNAAVEAAIGQQIDALIGSGRFTLAQVLDGLGQGTFAPSSTYPTQAQSEASYLAGGLTSDAAAALMAQIAAGSSDSTAAGAVASEIAALIAANRMDQTLAMSGIGAAAAAGVLDAAKAVVVLASMPLNVSDAIHTAAGGEIASLISAHSITLDQAVATLFAMAHQGQAVQQLEAGAALGLLVAQNVLDVATAISDVQAAVQSHALTADQAVAVLAGINVDGAAGVSAATGNAIASLIAQGEPVANVVSLLLTAAESGSTAIQAGAGAILGMLVDSSLVSATQAIQGIDTAFASGALPASAAVNLLLSMAATGNLGSELAAGQEIGHVVQAAGSTTELAAQLAAVNLSQDRAVLVLAAAVAGASTSALQTQIAALIQGMVTSGPISASQVMNDIDAAVGHGLTATQALTVLAHLEEAGTGAMRAAVLTETVALVTNHGVAATDAAAALIVAAHGGSAVLQSLVGGMLASLADHGLLTNQQVVDAVSGASTISAYEALGVLIGLGVNGGAAAQAASGAGILALVLNGRLDVQAVISLIDTEARQNTISPEHALDVVLNIMGAAIGSLNAGATGTVAAFDKYIRDQMSAEVAALTTSLSFNGNDGQATLLNAACGSVALAEAVGLSLAAMWAADQATPNPVVRNGSPWVPLLDNAVANHQMTADEALMLALASSVGGQQQTLLTGLVQSGAVTVDQTVHFLAVTAAQTGDTDTANPNLAYSGLGGSDPTLMTAAIRDLQALITGMTGVPALASSATVMNDIVAAAVSHDISGLQAAALLANLAGRLGTDDALVAAGAIGALVSQHQIDNLSAMQSIAWAIGATSGLSQSQANLMYASMALSTDAAVQQIAVWAYNSLGTQTLAQAFHAITANSSFTHDQAFTIITTIASGLATSGLQNASFVTSALAGEITAMVTSHQLTADHAVAMLASLAASSGFQLNSLGVELNALIVANAVSFNQAVNDLMHSALNVDQVVTALTGMSAANPSLDPQVLGQVMAMITAGTLTVAQAMADIGNAAPDTALRLLTACANAATNIEDAAAAEMATLLAQASNQSLINRFYAYAKANLDPVHAIGWIASIAAHGNGALQNYVDNQFQSEMSRGGSLGSYNIAALLANYLANFTPSAMVQYYIGQELGRLVDQSTTPSVTVSNIITSLEQLITGTPTHNDLVTTPGSTSGNLPKTMTADTAATVLLGLTNATHNADAKAAASTDLKLLGDQVDAKLVSTLAELMPPQQALTQFVTMVQNGWVNPALVAKQLSDMVAAGKLTVDQVITAMAPLDTGHQLMLVSEMLATNEISSNTLTSQFAALVLLTWGVAQTSPVYTSMHDALMQVVPDFVGLARGTTTASQAINDVKAAASAHGVSADLLLLAVYQGTAQDAGAGDFAGSASGALSQIGHELYSHLADGTAAQTVAHMVLSGGLHEDAAAALMQELAASATIPPNAIMHAVAGGEMSVWYADAHYPQWSSNSAEMAFTVTNAVGMMRVEVHSAEDVQAILNGTMTGAQAVADILAAGGGSEYAKDMGLTALVHGLEHTTAGADALRTVEGEIAIRIAGDSTADGLVSMAAHGWLSAQGAVDMLHREISAATTILDPAAGSLLECIALARLDQAASGQVDPNATAFQVQMHGGPTSHAIENILEGTDAAKILTGLGALQLVETDPYELGAGLALAQHVTSVLISQLDAQGAANLSSGDWAATLPPDMQNLMHNAEIASEYFNLGMGYAATGLADIKTGLNFMSPVIGAPYGEISDLSAKPDNIQRWVDLGVDLTLGGIPGNSLLLHADDLGFPLPTWATGIQGQIVEAAIGKEAAGAFNDVGVVVQVTTMILSVPAVANSMHDGGVTLSLFNSMNNTCSLINGMIAGTVHVAANMALAIATDTVNTFRDVCTGNDASAAAAQLGKDLFVQMTGVNFDNAAQVGDDVGLAMVDLFSGHPSNLRADADALGSDVLNMLSSSPLVQMAGGQISAYIGQMSDLLSARDAMMLAFFL